MPQDLQEQNKEYQLIRMLRLERNLTLQALADKAATTKSQIDKLEKGERRLTLDWIKRLAAALEIKPSIFFEDHTTRREQDDSTYNAALQEPQTAEYGVTSYGDVIAFPSSPQQEKLPVYGNVDALTGTLKNLETVVGNVFCPSPLQGVNGAYSIYVPDDSMAPRYEMGETLFLHPSKPLVAGCYVLVVTQDNKAYIQQFIGRTAGTVLLQGADKVAEPVPVKTLKTLHRVVGSWG